MDDEQLSRDRSWAQKFRDAFRGVKRGVRGQSSFAVHFFAAAAVVVAGIVVQLDELRWCLLALCIAMVLVAEMFNSALERLARAVDPRYNRQLRDALDVGSAAVLIAAGGAVVVGVIILGRGLLALFGG